MSRDAEAKPDPKTARLYDKRTVERNIKKGLVSRKDYEKHLKTLDDVGDKGVFGGPAEPEPVEAELAEDDTDDEDDADDETADDAPPLDGANNPH